MKKSKQSHTRRKSLEGNKSAYQIFFDEKRLEIIKLRVQEYDASLGVTPNEANIESNINLPNLNTQVHQMWTHLSSKDRNQFKVRAKLDLKRKYVAMKKTDAPMQDAGSWDAFSFDGSFSSAILSSADGDIILNLTPRSIVSSFSNLSTTIDHNQHVQDVKLDVKDNTSRAAADDDPVKFSETLSSSSKNQGTDGNPLMCIAHNHANLQGEYSQNNMNRMNCNGSQVPFHYARISSEYRNPTAMMRSDNLETNAPRYIYGVPYMYPYPYAYHSVSHPLYSQEYGLTLPPRSYCTFVGTYSPLSHYYPHYEFSEGMFFESAQQIESSTSHKNANPRNNP